MSLFIYSLRLHYFLLCFFQCIGKVVSALNEQQSQSANGVHVTTHVPYRESKLTRLLKDALGGHGMSKYTYCTMLNLLQCHIHNYFMKVI